MILVGYTTFFFAWFLLCTYTPWDFGSSPVSWQFFFFSLKSGFGRGLNAFTTGNLFGDTFT